MIDIETILIDHTVTAVANLYHKKVASDMIQVQRTRKEFSGDFTIVVFPLLRFSKKTPEQTAEELGKYLQEYVNEIEGFNVIKGFLNLKLDASYWFRFIKALSDGKDEELFPEVAEKASFLIEYSSPNTNKPLHLGHIRNNLLGYSIASILKAVGHEVIKVNLVNDRGIHICKSMLAWLKWGENVTPSEAGKKGDHFVGDYYVMFDKEYKKEVEELVAGGMDHEEAKKKAPLIREAQNMLRKWEQRDSETIQLWEKMNEWVLQGFDETYREMGVDFDKTYFESDTYKLGKEIVLNALSKGIFFKKEDGSVWADLAEQNLDQKLLLRGDGTSVYMTQDIGTAVMRVDDFKSDNLIYVVGNEQNYHFQVLKIILDQLGYKWAKNIIHLSYGMVELPEGKMKSREGTVVDADDMMLEMVQTAEEMSKELGKLEGLNEEQKRTVYKTIGLGALKYFILKVDPKKNMTFNPKESIDFNGNTGPFIQYSYARINSILRKAAEQNIELDFRGDTGELEEKELYMIKLLHKYQETVLEAAENMSPAVIANYVFDLAKEFNQFYHEHKILKETDEQLRLRRLVISSQVARIIKSSMQLLGADVPEKM